jgi:energy-converting hydrogenase Eha subunit F
LRDRRDEAEYRAIIGSMLAMAERASKANTRVQVVSDTMPLVEPPAPQPQAVYDQNGVPLDTPAEITLEDIQNLSTVLARAGE